MIHILFTNDKIESDCESDNDSYNEENRAVQEIIAHKVIAACNTLVDTYSKMIVGVLRIIN